MGYSLQPSMSLRKEEIMAWWENDRVTQRKKLIMEWLSGDFTVTELARRHDISRQKVYKWIERYDALGPEGLQDRSHRPHHCPHAAPDFVIEEAVRIRLSRRVPVGADKVRTLDGDIAPTILGGACVCGHIPWWLFGGNLGVKQVGLPLVDELSHGMSPADTAKAIADLS